MAAPTRTPRSAWIGQGLRALADGGPDAVRIEPLAQALGVTRGGFYWQFEDRGALLDAMLDTWERATTEEVVERLEREGGDASAKLRRLFALTSPAWCRPTWPSATGPGATRRSPSACGASTTGAWMTCARCSAASAPTRRRSRPAACSPSRC